MVARSACAIRFRCGSYPRWFLTREIAPLAALIVIQAIQGHRATSPLEDAASVQNPQQMLATARDFVRRDSYQNSDVHRTHSPNRLRSHREACVGVYARA
jgi:hypothetical protein